MRRRMVWAVGLWVVASAAWGPAAAAVGDRHTVSIALRYAVPSEVAVWLGCPAVQPRLDGRMQTVRRSPAGVAAEPLPDGVESVVGYDLLSAMIAVGTTDGLAALRQRVSELDTPPQALCLDAAVCRVRASLLPPTTVGGVGRLLLLEPEAAQALLDQAVTAQQDSALTSTGRATKVTLGRRVRAGEVAYTQASVQLWPGKDADVPALRVALAMGSEQLAAIGEHQGVPLYTMLPALVQMRGELPLGKSLLLVPEPTSLPLLPPMAAADLARCAVIGPLFGRELPDGMVEGLLLTPRPVGVTGLSTTAPPAE